MRFVRPARVFARHNQQRSRGELAAAAAAAAALCCALAAAAALWLEQIAVWECVRVPELQRRRPQAVWRQQQRRECRRGPASLRLSLSRKLTRDHVVPVVGAELNRCCSQRGQKRRVVMAAALEVVVVLFFGR